VLAWTWKMPPTVFESSGAESAMNSRVQLTSWPDGNSSPQSCSKGKWPPVILAGITGSHSLRRYIAENLLRD